MWRRLGDVGCLVNAAPGVGWLGAARVGHLTCFDRIVYQLRGEDRECDRQADHAPCRGEWRDSHRGSRLERDPDEKENQTTAIVCVVQGDRIGRALVPLVA